MLLREGGDKPQARGKHLQNTSDKVLVSQIHKEPLKVSNKKTNNAIQKGAKDLNRHLTTEAIMANKHVKRC